MRALQLSAVCVAVLLVVCGTARAAVIDFEEFTPPAGGMSWMASPFTSQGFTFTSTAQAYAIVHDDQSNIPDTGSNTLFTNGGSLSGFRLTDSSGAAFDLASALAAEGRNTNGGFFPEYSATSIEVLGTFMSGGTIATTLNLDLFAEENDALDFELFTFTGFSNLASVQFTGRGGPRDGYSFGLDDITLNPEPIPEPSTIALLGLGLIGLAWRRRRRQQTS